MNQGTGNEQRDSGRNFPQGYQTGAVPTDARQPGNTGFTGDTRGVDPGDTAASVVPGQAVDRTVMASAQGYANTSGHSRGESSAGREISPPRESQGGSVLDPNIDYFNKKLSKMNPRRLHEIIMRYQQTFDFNGFIENISYQGFNRTAYIQAALSKITVSQFSRLAIMGAIRGSNFAKIQGNSLNVDADLVSLVSQGIIVKTPKLKNDLSILRCTASIPQWCSYFMISAEVPPKLADSTLPNFLQFPAAASLPMSSDLRRLHVEFSIKFSQLIGGTFNPNIYMAAFNNQIPMSEIPDILRNRLGVSSSSESMQIGTQAIIKELSGALIKK